jgi:phenylacetic acid degradation operon negative regulatory protein
VTSARPSKVSKPRQRIARWIRRELERNPPRAKSLVVTVWGDAIAPHGGAVWLGGLIRLLAPLGLNERLVRTSVYRLAREGWLSARQDGRRSLYRLTAAGMRRFEQAYRRIYASPEAWDGAWQIVLGLDAMTPRERLQLRRELGWEGFGALAPGIFARPERVGGDADLGPLLAVLGVAPSAIVLQAREASGARSGSLAASVRQCWDLPRIASEYRVFLSRFRGVIADFHAARTIDPEEAFVVRSLLIHAFRRVTLHDPGLPGALSPAGWPAPKAYALCRDFYRLTQTRAEAHLASTLKSEAGALPPAAPYFYQRFGGL